MGYRTPMTQYTDATLAPAPLQWRRQLATSVQADGHRRFSVLSLALDLEVYPFRVHDALAAMRALIAAQEPEATESDLDVALYDGRRFGGWYELPEAHRDAAEYGPEVSDNYLTDGAIDFVREHVRRPSFLVMR